MVKEQCPNVTDEWLEAVVLAVNEEYVEPGDKVWPPARPHLHLAQSRSSPQVRAAPAFNPVVPLVSRSPRTQVDLKAGDEVAFIPPISGG
jgi:hypothetical protein